MQRLFSMVSRVLIGVLVVGFLFGAARSALTASIQWSGNGHYYEVVSAGAPISWDWANASAVSVGKYLATITSQQENDFVFSLVDQAQYWYSPYGTNNYGPWLGGYQSPPTTQPAENWNWVTSEPWNYTNWASGEPNDFQGLKQDKTMYVAKGTSVLRASTWNDEVSNGYEGNAPIAYVVEWIPEPTALILAMVAAGISLAYRRRSQSDDIESRTLLGIQVGGLPCNGSSERFRIP